MKAVIIEDETAAVRNLKAILADLAPEIKIVATLDSVKKSVAWFGNHPAPDLIFMDIHLADGQSFLIFNQVHVESPVIFTTAYDEYALEAFKVNSIDYLLKPINPENVSRALAKFQKLTQNDKEDYSARIAKLISTRSYFRTFLIPVKDKLIPLPTGKISHFYSKNEKVVICTLEGHSYPYDKTLDSLMDKLDPATFFRANRQYIIAHQAVKEVVVWFGSRLAVKLISETSERIIISKARVSSFKKWLIKN
ncbi:MAG: DNA-binding response regulator [Bacteroidetes bacterium GWF2_42_66]|nr:MAG: DNA-binding response regulator [Bacteroidetes bacterium GWA2_42_15]OFY00137.1 MAG: DNA-binding response regulator [Bacteroidetes bacterium GWE2_42_39]OFY40279.1 MAG: DNA-binding response regulator [Bacteroidetes bacterium GWF2_42_66]HBL73740.1 DNA-binding response regulator [Prolixibacteraceae bacterium]HCR91203.1 DNA-binding response regulator [Prolixibacteraceae bacterium]